MLLRDWSYDPASAHPLLLTPLHTRNIAYRAAYTDPDYGRIVPEPVYVSSLDVRLIPSATLADDIGDIQLAATDGARRRYYQAGRSITETDAAMLIADRFAETGTDLIDYIDTFNGSFSRERDTEIREWARLLIETAASIGRYPSVRHALLAQRAPAIPTPSTAVAVERYRDTLTEPGFIASAQLAQNAFRKHQSRLFGVFIEINFHRRFRGFRRFRRGRRFRRPGPRNVGRGGERKNCQ